MLSAAKLWAVEKTLKESGEKIDSGLKDQINGSIKELKKELDNESINVKAVKDKIDVLSNFLTDLSQQLYQQQEEKAEKSKSGAKTEENSNQNNDDAIDVDFEEL